MKIIKQVDKNITGLNYPMFLCEYEDGSQIYLPETLIYKKNYTQISIFELMEEKK